MASCKFHRQLLKAALKLAPKYHTRRLSLHDYQSQQILKEYGLTVPLATLAESPEAARAAAQKLGPSCVIKAHVLGGGRAAGIFENGFKGGVHVVSSPSQAEAVASQMLHQRLRTKNSGVDGTLVEKVSVSQVVQHDAQWYAAVTIDRENYQPVFTFSKAGGIDLDVLLNEQPESIYNFPVSLRNGITEELVETVATRLGTKGQETEHLRQLITRLYKIFLDREATNLEINPLARAVDGELICLNANFTFDDAAEKRQTEIFTLRDKSQEARDEVEAEQHGLVYVRMGGDIGTVVNGAGLAMATNDAIGLYGGTSANFLDGGGKATKETMIQAFRIIIGDERVKAIFVNIYGGLTRCDMVAESIIGAASQLVIKVPMVVRLQGTNADAGLKLLDEANLGLFVESDFGRAAEMAVKLAKS